MVRDETVLLALNQLTNWGILQTDAALTITGCNEWLQGQLRHSAGSVLGRPLLETFPNLVTRRLDQFYQQALQGQVVVLAQRFHKYLLPLPPSVEGGTLTHMQQSVRIVPLVQDGVVVGTLTLIEDVTERVASELELSARARQQAAVAMLGQRALAGDDLAPLLYDTATVAVKALGMDFGEIWELGAGGQTLLLEAGVGYEEGCVESLAVAVGPTSYPGRTLEGRVPLLFKDLAQEPRFPALAHWRKHGIVSGLSVPLMGGEHPLGVMAVYSSRPCTFSEESVQAFQSIANVLGMAIERKRLERELQLRVDQLADADRRKDEFLAMLAHELRNPLAPIRNAVQFLQLKGSPNTELSNARDVIERQVHQISRLVDDLLDVSRITRGKVILRKEPVDLATVVTRAVEISRPLIDARKHDLVLALPAEALIVQADVVRLTQVVANLLNNAAKFTEEGGRIDLTVGREQDEAVLRVRDTGVGIAPAMLSTIFEMFTQVQGSVSRSEGGLGIGLSLVRSLMEMHEGSVSAQSEGPGRGSEFVIRLPLLKDATLPAAAVREQRPKGQWAPARRFLVVDDNVDAAETLALLLRLYGHDVSTAYDGSAALEAARTQAPDVVLLDIGLPHLNGLEVASLMRQKLGLKDALLIALSGYGQDEDRQRSLEAGFNAHLVKPVDLDLLADLLSHSEAMVRDPQRSLQE